VPNIGDQNLLPSITESFLDRKNQAGSDAMIPDTSIDNQLTEVRPESRIELRCHDVEVFKDVKDIFKDNPIEGFTKGTGGTEYGFLLPARPGGSNCPSAVFRKYAFR
jgi:hypothetical protein